MKDATKAILAGRNPDENFGVVNPPVYHASTILWSKVQDFHDSRQIRPGDGVTYGVHGTPGTFAFEEAVAALEGGYRTRLAPSGLAAVTGALLAYLKAGDHLLMVDSTYGPTRTFCDGFLKRMGVETEYYDPLIGAGIRELMRDNTAIVFLEAPGSWTFEMQDIPAIAEEARKRNAVVMMDNTWASPLYFKPFEHGVDVSIQAATKYISGHSDLVLGTVTTTEAAYPALQKFWYEFGMCASPDDIYLAQRGIRTIATRLKQHWESGLRLAHWLQEQDLVAGVLHPALETDPGHALWQRDFLGASGLFSFVLKEGVSPQGIAAMLDDLALYGMGYSWGGYESLIIPINPPALRTATTWPRDPALTGPVMRIHVGLEDPDDLIDDLSEGFKRMAKAG